jgi:hypothetical protein
VKDGLEIETRSRGRDVLYSLAWRVHNNSTLRNGPL